ncbi:DUF1304 domain-containing protein [Rothia nasimurium]|uniref:DUF1304 domain-containing protein n=1 Tax=Rothia nasimurium TaxID=85336 RepID=UPI001F448B1A|nr:DUF1304 domain-containing protein [Rothia nasimurium]
MTIAGLIALFLAVALHFFIFYLESFAWTTRALSVFGMSRESAEQTKEMAYNQGFYNLFLGIIAALGAVFYWAGSTQVGLALALAGTGSMVAAATVLFITSPDKRAAAMKQGIFPLLAVLLLGVGALI